MLQGPFYRSVGCYRLVSLSHIKSFLCTSVHTPWIPVRSKHFLCQITNELINKPTNKQINKSQIICKQVTKPREDHLIPGKHAIFLR